MGNNVPPLQIKYKREEVPHVVIEVNQKCNITCPGCYKDLSGSSKPFELIKQEIDYALTKRRIRAFTIAGGEPTIHPDLTRVIEYISSKGIESHILTNGVGLAEDKLKAYKKAGLSDVFLHIDKFQKRPDIEKISKDSQLKNFREEIGKRVVDSGIRCSLSVILYRKSLDEIEDIISFILTSKIFNRMLIVCFNDFRTFAYYFNNDIQGFDDAKLDSQVVRNKEVEQLLFEELKMLPYAYIGSSHSSSEKRWMYYSTFSLHKNNGEIKILHVSPKFKYFINFVNWLSRKTKTQNPLRGPKIMENAVIVAILYAFFSFDLKIIINTIGFLINMLKPGTVLNQKRFVFQQAPNLKSDMTLEFCHNCPDATVRDGILTPLCLADVINKDKRIVL